AWGGRGAVAPVDGRGKVGGDGAGVGIGEGRHRAAEGRAFGGAERDARDGERFIVRLENRQAVISRVAHENRSRLARPLGEELAQGRSGGLVPGQAIAVETGAG